MFLVVNLIGELAQLARAPALHVGGHRFDSDILHNKWKEDDLGHQFSRFIGMIFSTAFFAKARIFAGLVIALQRYPIKLGY